MLGEWGLLKPRVFHMSNSCMTSVTLVEKLVIVLLTFLCRHLGMGVPVSVFLCCNVRWGEVKYLSKIRYAAVCRCQEFLTSAKALPCPYSPPFCSLSAPDGYGAGLLHACGSLMIACMLPNSTVSLKL